MTTMYRLLLLEVVEWSQCGGDHGVVVVAVVIVAVVVVIVVVVMIR